MRGATIGRAAEVGDYCVSLRRPGKHGRLVVALYRAAVSEDLRRIWRLVRDLGSTTYCQTQRWDAGIAVRLWAVGLGVPHVAGARHGARVGCETARRRPTAS